MNRYGGSRIAHIFRDIFARTLRGINPFDHLTDAQIRTAILNATVSVCVHIGACLCAACVCMQFVAHVVNA